MNNTDRGGTAGAQLQNNTIWLNILLADHVTANVTGLHTESLQPPEQLCYRSRFELKAKALQMRLFEFYRCLVIKYLIKMEIHSKVGEILKCGLK